MNFTHDFPIYLANQKYTTKRWKREVKKQQNRNSVWYWKEESRTSAFSSITTQAYNTAPRWCPLPPRRGAAFTSNSRELRGTIRYIQHLSTLSLSLNYIYITDNKVGMLASVSRHSPPTSFPFLILKHHRVAKFLSSWKNFRPPKKTAFCRRRKAKLIFIEPTLYSTTSARRWTSRTSKGRKTLGTLFRLVILNWRKQGRAGATGAEFKYCFCAYFQFVYVLPSQGESSKYARFGSVSFTLSSSPSLSFTHFVLTPIFSHVHVAVSCYRWLNPLF